MADGQQQGDYTSNENFEYAEGNYTEDNFAQDGDAQMTDVDGGEGGTQTANGNAGKDGSAHKGDDSDEEERKLFIGGISWETEQSDLKEYFGKYGEVVDVNIKTDPATRKSRGFGFITFATQGGVEQVLNNCPHTIKGKQVDPKRAKARPGIKKIFVGGLESDIPEENIKAYFEKFGKVEAIEIPFDKVKNQRRQFCFVTFVSEKTVDEVCKQSKQKIGNKECDIKKAAPKPDAFGGGRGGPGGFGGRGGRGGRGGGRGFGGRGGYGDQNWGAGGYGGGYGQGYGQGGYNQGGYGNYGGYDYNNYGGGYNSGYGGYDYSGWNYGQGQQQGSGGNYGKSRRGNSGGNQGYHPYSR